ncbi:MAG: extracellular solute-binding protein [Chloroflexota bacterium]|nr:extracellular solute-binding protein [Chloroflexota bacterium]
MKKLIILVSLLTLSACTPNQPVPAIPTTIMNPPPPATTSLATQRTSIVLWHNWSTSQAQAYTKIIAAFNATHPTLALQPVKIEALDDALAVALPTGEGPDLIHWTADQIGAHALAGDIVPMDDYLPEGYLTDNFEPAAAQAMRWRTQNWGIPATQAGLALIYNRDQLRKSDLPTPTDFNDLLEKARAFRRAHPAKYYLCNPGLGQAAAEHVAPIYLGHGLNQYGGLVDDQGQVYLNRGAGYEAANWIAEFSKVAPAKASFSLCQELFTSGQVPIWWDGPRALISLEGTGLNYGIAPMGSPYVEVTLFMLTANAVSRGHAPAAVTVLQYLGSAAVQQELATTQGVVPANSQALHSLAVQTSPYIAGFGAALHLGTPWPNHPYGVCQWEALGVATLAIWEGRAAPLPAINAAQKTIESCVTEISE